MDFVKPKLMEILSVCRNQTFLILFLLMFFVFFVFQALLNFLPFQLQTLSNNVSYGKVGMMYAGYMIGFMISIRVLWIIKLFGNETKAILIGLLIYLFGLQLFYISNYTVMFLGMFVVCAGFFIIHSVASGWMNKHAHEKRAISNGLYLSFYYSGGTIGTFAPGVFFEYLGWNSFIILLSCIVFILFFLLLFFKKRLRV